MVVLIFEKNSLKFVSSANSVVANYDALGKSFTYIENSEGPKTKLCGTAYSPTDGLDNFCFIFTQIIYRAKYNCKKLKIGLRNL